MKKRFDGVIESVLEEAEGSRRVLIRLREPFSFLPGQYCMLAFPDEENVKRAFSIVKMEGRLLTFCVKESGVFTRRLFSSGKGDGIVIYGPYGRFILPEDRGSDIIFIAGGVGITPLYCMLSHCLKTGHEGKLALFYSVRKRSEMCLSGEISSLNAENLLVKVHFTREGDKRFSVSDIKSLCPFFSSSFFYLCGSPSMVSDVRSKLLSAGISESKIHSEAF